MEVRVKGGRPTHQPTNERRKMVESMSAVGASQAEICLILDIDEKTLRKHYRREIDTGATRANMAVAENFFKVCTAKEDTAAKVSAQKFWLERRNGWAAPQREPPERDFVPEILGKKAQQARDAENAGAGTEWGDDLVPPGLLN